MHLCGHPVCPSKARKIRKKVGGPRLLFAALLHFWPGGCHRPHGCRTESGSAKAHWRAGLHGGVRLQACEVGSEPRDVCITAMLLVSWVGV